MGGLFISLNYVPTIEPEIFSESFTKISYDIDYFDTNFQVSCIDFLAKYDSGHCQYSLSMIQSEDGLFVESKIEHDINILKCNKSVGIDDIPAEV